MGAQRETASLWYWLFQEGKYYPDYKRTFKKLFNNPYFWSDSFGRYINRYLLCKIFGHRQPAWIDDDNSILNLHCFSCASVLESWPNPASWPNSVPPFKDDNQKPYAGN